MLGRWSILELPTLLEAFLVALIALVALVFALVFALDDGHTWLCVHHGSRRPNCPLNTRVDKTP